MKGQIVVVTGGASGIGHACCQALAKKAWKVITGINLPVDAGWPVAQGWKTYPGIRGDWP